VAQRAMNNCAARSPVDALEMSRRGATHQLSRAIRAPAQ
jgi:hypothetical protein